MRRGCVFRSACSAEAVEEEEEEVEATATKHAFRSSPLAGGAKPQKRARAWHLRIYRVLQRRQSIRELLI